MALAASNYLKQLRILTKISNVGLSHAELTFSRIKHDEQDVAKAMELLTCSWIDPFAGDKTRGKSLLGKSSSNKGCR